MATTVRSTLEARAADVSGWGGGPTAPVTLVTPETVDQVREAAQEYPRAIARGMGRSYGDAAQLRDGNVIETRRLDAVQLDREHGIVTAQAGATLGALLRLLEPFGWVLPVVPGTQHVSIGGAIASDIHGKNHGAAGTFGSHVLELGLLTASGEVLTLTPDDGGQLLAATTGGMGLTGIILWARIRLRPAGGNSLSVDTDRVDSLDEALSVLDAPGGVHRVAWLDLLSRKRVRGIVTRADSIEAEAGELTVSSRLEVPARWRRNVLSPGAVRAHNEVRFRRAPQRARGRIESFGSHMFPLDVLDAWPRLYGPAGFIQYQLVVPRGQEAALETVLERLRRSMVPCYLAVLKDFGAGNGAPLSFPLAGWTLALDLPRAPGLEPLLSGFDELVVAAGGRVYLAKDGRLCADVLATMYPRLPEWRAIRDRIDPERRWCSDLGLRTGLVDG